MILRLIVPVAGHHMDANYDNSLSDDLAMAESSVTLQYCKKYLIKKKRVIKSNVKFSSAPPPPPLNTIQITSILLHHLHLPRRQDEIIKFSCQMPSDNILRRWNAQRGRHCIAGEGRLQDESAMNAAIWNFNSHPGNEIARLISRPGMQCHTHPLDCPHTLPNQLCAPT